MDLKEQQNIIDSVNHIGRIVKRFASCNVGPRAFGAKIEGMRNYLQLGHSLQFPTFLGTFGTIGGTIGAICGTVRKIRGNICDHFEANCVTIGAIVKLLGQFGALLGQFVASIFLYVHMLLYIKASMTS